MEKKEKAPKKETEKRQNAFGRTVPWSAKPSQKVQERMARAMPGAQLHSAMHFIAWIYASNLS